MGAAMNSRSMQVTNSKLLSGACGKWMMVLALTLTSVPNAAADGTPPRDLHMVGDHWTAWQPPAPPYGPETYIIQRGDTLWELAAQHLGDPYLWPQIWESNRYILDAHWIYPGDPLWITGSALLAPADGVVGEPLDEAGAIPDALAEGTDADDPFSSILESESEGGWTADVKKSPPVPLGTESDIYCSGYVGDIDESFPYRVASSEYEFLTPTLDVMPDTGLEGLYGRVDTQKYGLSTGDILYLEGGLNQGLSAGELLTAIQPRDVVIHPESGAKVGRFYEYLGRVRVLSTQDETSIAEIVRLCEPITVGSKLKLFEPEPVPLRRRTAMRPINYPAAAEALDGAPTIVRSSEGVITMGNGYLVYIDHGERQDVLPGDVFTIYRRGRRGYPPLVLGEVGILSVRENTALGNILESRYSIHVGDALLIK